ncbi:MAG: hypothetical protein H7338_18815 [Candidatus Sericytochromatia bacterium]|nr:hypothetical protein [Candidatus Sericytochromatia bacterium]
MIETVAYFWHSQPLSVAIRRLRPTVSVAAFAGMVWVSPPQIDTVLDRLGVPELVLRLSGRGAYEAATEPLPGIQHDYHPTEVH